MVRVWRGKVWLALAAAGSAAAALPACQHEAPRPQAPQESVLFDFRANPPEITKDVPARPRLGAEERRSVLSALFPKYLTGTEDCPLDDTGMAFDEAIKRARKTGAIAPEILGKATGAFTRAGSRETAYLVSVGECISNPAFTTQQLAIFGEHPAGIKPVLSEEIVAREILGVFEIPGEIPGEARQGLVLAAGGAEQGIRSANARAVAAQDGKLKTVRAFGPIYEDSCGAGLPQGKIEAAVILPDFSVHRFEAACAGGGYARFEPAETR